MTLFCFSYACTTRVEENVGKYCKFMATRKEGNQLICLFFSICFDERMEGNVLGELQRMMAIIILSKTYLISCKLVSTGNSHRNSLSF